MSSSAPSGSGDPSSVSSVAQGSSSATSDPSTSSPNAPTSANPITSSTSSSTPQSSPTQTSAAAVQTTPSSPSPSNIDSGSSRSTTTPGPTTTSTSTFTSQVATTFSSTNSDGSVVIFTSTVPEVITTSITTTSGGGGTNNTGIIVGAVVGGVTGVILLVVLLFCIRKRVRKDEFDGNFDPDRVIGHADSGTLPNVDLTDEVTPFPRNQSYANQGGSSMRQHEKAPYMPVPSSFGGGGYNGTDFYPAGAVGAGIDTQPRFGAGPPPPGAYAPQINMYGMGPVDWHTPLPGASPPPSTISNNTSSTRRTKEREAIGHGGLGTGLGLATPQELPEGSGDVVVHQDAGRAPIEEHVPPREIPPAYESIRQD